MPGFADPPPVHLRPSHWAKRLHRKPIGCVVAIATLRRRSCSSRSITHTRFPPRPANQSAHRARLRCAASYGLAHHHKAHLSRTSTCKKSNHRVWPVRSQAMTEIRESDQTHEAFNAECASNAGGITPFFNDDRKPIRPCRQRNNPRLRPCAHRRHGRPSPCKRRVDALLPVHVHGHGR